MIDYIINNSIVKQTSRWWLICMLLCCMASCTDEDSFNQSPDSDQATLVLNIKTPASSILHPATRSLQTIDETTVANIKVLVFSDANGDGSYRFSYMADGTQLESRQDQTSRFQVMLRSSSLPMKFFLVANYADAFSTYTPASGEDEATVKTSLRMNFTSDGLSKNLPMYGEISVYGLDAATINVFDVSVLRAIARVDVKTALSPESTAFALREVYAFRTNNQIQIIPNALTSNETMRVASPSVPTGSALLPQPVGKSSAVPTDSIGGVYIPESLSTDDSGQSKVSATTVVVGGTFGNDTVTTYYRVDFNSGMEGHSFGQVLRNYLYTFYIKSVSAPGFPTAEEAAENLASSMTVEVHQWEDFTTDMFFHDNYIGLSTRQVSLPYLPNYTQTIDVEASLNYQMQWLDTPEAGTVSESGVPLSNGYFTATIIRDASEAPTVSHIRIESSEYNTSDQPVKATLRLIANGTAADITIIKESSAKVTPKTIRVLSMGTGYGSLGSFNATVVATLPMRRILDTNFSTTSSYPVKTGGFFFLTVPLSDPNFTNATTDASLAVFKRLISDFDVLVLTYTNVVSQQVTDLLLDEWLVEDTHRVLWVMRDDKNTNANLLARLASEGEGVWENIGDAFDVNAGYRYSNKADYAYNNEEEVDEFFNGPFGSIDNTPGKQILRPGNIVSGACKIEDSSKQFVTPLVYSNKAGYTDYMAVGVNKKRGIVYQGESEFFEYNLGMSLSAYTNGTLTTGPSDNGKYYFDVLMSNIWAWVAGRVLYGAAS